MIVVVVDGDDGPSRGVEHRGGHGCPVAAVTVHPDLPVRHLAETPRQFVQGDVHGAVEVGSGPFQVAAHVQHDDGAMAADRGQGAEVRDREAAQWPPAGPLGRATGGGRRGVSMATISIMAVGNPDGQ